MSKPMDHFDGLKPYTEATGKPHDRVKCPNCGGVVKYKWSTNGVATYICRNLLCDTAIKVYPAGRREVVGEGYDDGH